VRHFGDPEEAIYSTDFSLNTDRHFGEGTTDTVTIVVTGRAMSNTKLKIGLNFAEAGKDKMKASGALQVPEGFDPNGKTVELNVGGVLVSGVMDAKGNVKADGFKFKLKLSKKASSGMLAAKFKASLKDGDWADDLEDDGCVDDDVAGDAVRIPLQLTLGEYVYTTTVPGTWKAKTGKKGAFKGP